MKGQAGLGYQLGFNSSAYSRFDSAQFYTGYSTRSRSDDWKVKSGLDFAKNFKISLNYNYRTSRNASNSVNGTITESQLYFFKSSGDSVGIFQIPIPEWSVSWTEVGEIRAIPQRGTDGIVRAHLYRIEDYGLDAAGQQYQQVRLRP